METGSETGSECVNKPLRCPCIDFHGHFIFPVYTIVTPPEEGNIIRIEERNNQQKKRRLAANANFTQVNLYKGFLRSDWWQFIFIINAKLIGNFLINNFIILFQDDINKNKIMFRLHKALFAQILDSFQFRVSVPGAQTVVREFSIRYVVVSLSFMCLSFNCLMRII